MRGDIIDMRFSDLIFTSLGKEESMSALYKCSDGGLYQIISLDSDTAIMCSADGKQFTVAAKPYLDESANVIDFSSKENFRSLSEAKKYSEELHLLFETPRRVIDMEIAAETKTRTGYEPVRIKRKSV